MSEREVLRNVDEYTATKAQLLEFVRQNQTTFDEFFALLGRRNNAISAVKAALRDLNTEEVYKSGPFTRSKITTGVTFDAEDLPKEVLDHPGVIKSIDAGKVEALVKDGTISFGDVELARHLVKSSAKIYGPKEEVVTL